MSAPRPRPPILVAIVGLACRFPGGASSAERFWRNLLDGVDGITEVPPDRWDLRKFYSPDGARSGAANVRRAGFLREDVFAFDPDFFGISARDAEPMDVQQRLLLETAWETFEDAGLTRAQVEGSRTGVFVGAFFLDVNQFQFLPANRALIDAATATAGTATMVSNRISFAFDLRGPSVSLDTACSSSLVAAHLACRAIAAGDADQALVGGANFITVPEVMVAMTKGGFLSPDGYCYSFDARANGYVRAEGAGMMLLKPLDAAVRDGDRVYAVIEATGCNQDGRTPQGITFPNGGAQRALIERTLAEAGVRAREVQYLEAHGTGTQAGDTTELGTLHGVLEADGVADRRWVGSLKSQIGHLEAAAGVGSLIKTALALHHGVIPPNLHFETPNPAVDFGRLLLDVPTRPVPWPAAAPRRAVVNGFGYGGTNACAVLRSAPAAAAVGAAAAGPALIPLGAKDPAALRALAAALAAHLDRDDAPALVDVARTTQAHRTHFEHRAAVVAEDVPALVKRLRGWVAGEAEGVCEGRVPPRAGAGLVFVFSGMGPQWWAMGRALLDESAVFAAAAAEVDAVFRRVAGWSVLDAMRADEGRSRMGETAVAQPANFVLQVALTRLLAHHGITADAMVGHSVGEVAALYLSGAVSLEDAVLISFHRSRLQQQAAGGGMLAVGLGEAAFRERYGEWLVAGKGVALAAVNSPDAITLAGDRPALAALAEVLHGDGHFQRALRVDTAYHSHHMDPIRDALLDELDGLRPRAQAVRLYSSVTGGLRPGPGWGAEYWWQNVRAPVRFAAAIEALLGDGYALFVEVGPHPVLAGAVREIARAAGKAAEVVSTLRRDQPEGPAVMRAIGELFVRGVTPRWATLRGGEGRRVALPHYPFQRIRLWRESETARRERIGCAAPVFLQERAATATPTWSVALNDQMFPFVPDHRVAGAAVFPGAGYLAAAVAAQHALAPDAATSLHDVHFVRVLALAPTAMQTLQTTLDPESGRFAVHSAAAEGAAAPVWVTHARGRVGEEAVTPRCLDLDARALPRSIEPAAFYERLAKLGLAYGPAFRSVTALAVGPGAAIATLEAPEAPGDADYRLRPVLVDGAFQCLVALLDGDAGAGPFVPTDIHRVRLRLPWPRRCRVLIDRVVARPDRLTADITWTDEDGAVLGELFGVTCRPVSAADDAQHLADRVWTVQPRPLPPLAAAEPVAGAALILPPSDPALAERLLQIARSRGLDAELCARAALDARLEAAPPAFVLDARALDAPAGIAAPGEAAARLYDRAALLGRLLGGQTHLEVLTRRALRVRPDDPADQLAAAAIGELLHVAANEAPPLRPRLIDVDDASWPALAAELFRPIPDTLVALRDGARFGPTFEALDLRRGRRAAVDPAAVPVRLDGAPTTLGARPPAPGEVVIAVRAWCADGPVAEVAGVVLDGDRWPAGTPVQALVAGPVASRVIVPADAAWPIEAPGAGPQWGAAAAFLADHALGTLAGLGAGDRLLVDVASPELAAAVAAEGARRGAEVSATRRAPIAAARVLTDDAAARMALDGGVFHAVFTDRPAASAPLLAAFGHLLTTAAAPAPLPANASQHALDLDALLRARPATVARWRAHAAPPAARAEVVVPWGEVPPPDVDARVIREAPRGAIEAEASDDDAAVPRGGWIVTGGTRGFGLALAAWLAGEGATHLLLVSRSGAVAADDAATVAAIRAAGVTVEALALDVADEAAVAALAERVRAWDAPLAGIAHAAVAYADEPLAALTADAFHRVFAVKARALHALYELAVTTGAAVVLCVSSISALIGNRGQASYVAANAYLDAFARNAAGRPGPRVCSVDVGALAETGHAQQSDLLDYFERAGILPISNAEALRAIRHALARHEAQIAVSGFHWPAFTRAFEPLMQTTRFAAWRDDGDPSHRPLGERLQALAPAERAPAVVTALRQILGAILKTAPERIDEHRSAATLGIDSLSTMELTVAVQREIGARVTAVDLLADPTVLEIADLIVSRRLNTGALA